ncbi:MAG: pilus assembly protein TadG-related protein [Rubritepida sp.]|nr:pilus assembly protein TadG-related protein [Rubritepida sp.]MCU0946276.1 pilus assembly protein TadG-related protein [Rubritepida sp.]
MRGFARFARARRGSVAAMVALAGIVLAGFAAVAVDAARAWLLHARLVAAVDAAALAGARAIFLPAAQRDAEAAGIFWANIGVNEQGFAAAEAVGRGWRSRLDSTVTLLSLAPAGERDFEVRARAVLPTTLGRVLGREAFAMEASGRARRAELGMEVALVLDVTGSMETGCATPSNRTGAACAVTPVPRDPGTEVAARANNMDLLRLAAADLVNVLFGPREVVDNLWVSVVPYTTAVNVGPGRANWLEERARATLEADFAPTRWRGCVEARVGYPGAPVDGDRSEATPFEAPFRPFLYRSTLGVYTLNGQAAAGDNDWARRLWTPTTTGPNAITEDWHFWRGNHQVGPNVGCPSVPVLPLEASKTRILDTIQALRPAFRGGTMGNLGLLHGWHTLSPRWREAWALGPPPPLQPTSLPLDYNRTSMRKVIVLMTDGENLWFDHPGGFPGGCTERSVDNASVPGASADRGGPPAPTVGSAFPPGPPMPHRPIACPPAGQEGAVQVAPGGPPIAGNADYTGYGRLAERRLGAGITNNSQAQAEVNRRMAELCTTIKSRGITIYSVVLDTSGRGVNEATRSLYQGCASSAANYFLVTRPGDLRAAFRQIGTELASLRLLP